MIFFSVLWGCVWLIGCASAGLRGLGADSPPPSVTNSWHWPWTPNSGNSAANIKYKIRVASDLHASLDQPSANNEQVELFSRLLEKMADPEEKDHHDVTHFIIAGGLLSFSSTPSATTPLPPRDIVEAVFSGKKTYWNTKTEEQLMRLGSSIKKFVAVPKSFIWLPGAREFNISADVVAQSWPELDPEYFFVPESPRFMRWGLCVSSGRENDFFAEPVPSTRRPFSYYIDRLVADALQGGRASSIPRQLEWGVAQRVMSRAFKSITPSAALSTLQLFDPNEMRDLLAEALRSASGKSHLEESHVFKNGHWNIVMTRNGTLESTSPVYHKPSVTVGEVLEQFEFLVEDWLAEVGEAPTAKILYTTAYSDLNEALTDLIDTPEVAVIGHTMQPLNSMSTPNGIRILFPGWWFVGTEDIGHDDTDTRSSDHSSMKTAYDDRRPTPQPVIEADVPVATSVPPLSSSSTGFVDIYIGPTFTGALRPLRAELFYLSHEGVAIPFGTIWERDYIASAGVIWGCLAAGAALLLLFVLAMVSCALASTIHSSGGGAAGNASSGAVGAVPSAIEIKRLLSTRSQSEARSRRGGPAGGSDVAAPEQLQRLLSSADFDQPQPQDDEMIDTLRGGLVEDESESSRRQDNTWQRDIVHTNVRPCEPAAASHVSKRNSITSVTSKRRSSVSGSPWPPPAGVEDDMSHQPGGGVVVVGAPPTAYTSFLSARKKKHEALLEAPAAAYSNELPQPGGGLRRTSLWGFGPPVAAASLTARLPHRRASSVGESRTEGIDEEHPEFLEGDMGHVPYSSGLPGGHRRHSTANELIDQIYELQQTHRLNRRDTDRMIRNSISEHFREKRKLEKLSNTQRLSDHLQGQG